MQRDSGTYCDEPEDEDDFEAWKTTFSLEAAAGEAGKLLRTSARPTLNR